MKSKLFAWNILFRALLVFVSLFLASLALVKVFYLAELILVPVIIYQFIDYYNYHKKAQSEIEQFVESVHYRDFTRHFEVNKAPTELQPFRSGFNKINTTFKIISREKETQYLHLKTILEIVDTGILSYQVDTGEIVWMNEALKNLLQIPYLKTFHSLEKRNTELYKAITLLKAGENCVFVIPKEKQPIKVLLSATMFSNEDKQYKLIAFQNINEALDEEEAKAWQKLLSVMTHEIMNSVAPISSLAETLKNRIHDSIQGTENANDALGDIETGINTIQKRSEGLLKFTETYRSLSKITKANVSRVLIIEMVEHVQQLMQPTLDKKNVVLDIILRDPFLSLDVDSALIEQVLINILLNAVDAVGDRPEARISITAESKLNGKVVIRIADNGCGIQTDLLDKIFIPFFSTKKAGSGIGLSLCKQVMLLHKGNIQVQSVIGEGTVFTLLFS